jgi:Fe-S cluster biosynthesis and repair protein YggX
MYYPAWVYSINEDITRRNMAQYDKQQTMIVTEARKRNPNYDKLTLRERYLLKREVEKGLGID